MPSGDPVHVAMNLELDKAMCELARKGTAEGLSVQL